MALQADETAQGSAVVAVGRGPRGCVDAIDLLLNAGASATRCGASVFPFTIPQVCPEPVLAKHHSCFHRESLGGIRNAARFFCRLRAAKRLHGALHSYIRRKCTTHIQFLSLNLERKW
jgi:hypothetical protein